MSTPVTKDFLKNYYEDEGKRFEGDRFVSGIHRRYMVHACRHAILERWLNEIPPTGTFLEVGCEFGYFVRMMAARGLMATGVDIAKSKIEKALTFAKQENLTCQFEVMDAEKLDALADKSYDYVLCSEVLEHLPNDDLALKELFRITNKQLLLTVPKRSFYWKIMNKFYGFNKFDAVGGGHFREYRREEMVAKLDQYPSKNREVYYAGFISPGFDKWAHKHPKMQAVLCFRIDI